MQKSKRLCKLFAGISPAHPDNNRPLVLSGSNTDDLRAREASAGNILNNGFAGAIVPFNDVRV